MADDGDRPGAHQAFAAEATVLRALAKGLSNREIGARMHLSELTVKVHVGRILTTLGLRDRAQVIVFAYEHGIVRPGRE
ncbi:response regulator transcription factor [Crossiella sp. CA198]|uniref:response regulator transcription factor n=1 Tax=Crossiella sp. CA198 TaxID=3455607 RepID=UPI003F8D89F3